MTDRTPRRRRWIVGAVVVAAALVMSLVLTRHEVGMSTDSAAYLSAAQGLEQGHGLTMPYQPNTEPVPRPIVAGQRVTLSAFPPLYPAAVAALATLTGQDVFAVARGLDAVVFALTAALAFVAVARRTGSPWWAGLAVLLLLTADLVLVHAMAWAEALFILFTLAGLIALDRYVDQPRPSRLAVLAALVMAGVATRQIGLATAATAVIVIVAVVRGGGWRRWGAAGAVAVAGVVPVAGWALANPALRAGRNPTSVAWHPVTLHDARTLAGTVTDWFVSVDALGTVAGAFVVLVGAAALVAVCRWRDGTDEAGPTTGGRATTHLPLISVVYAGVYTAAVAVADSFLGVGTVGFGTRIYTPVHAALIVGGTVFVARAVAGHPRRRMLAVGLVAAVAAVGLGRSALLVARFDSSADKGLTNDVARASATLAAVRALPDDTVIVTDRAGLVWVATGRSVVALPPERVFATGAVNHDRGDELAEVAATIDGRPAVLVLFDQDPSVVDQATGPHLARGPAQEFADGSITPLSTRSDG